MREDDKRHKEDGLDDPARNSVVRGVRCVLCVARVFAHSERGRVASFVLVIKDVCRVRLTHIGEFKRVGHLRDVLKGILVQPRCARFSRRRGWAGACQSLWPRHCSLQSRDVRVLILHVARVCVCVCVCCVCVPLPLATAIKVVCNDLGRRVPVGVCCG
jgi:hypothetical protein